jgi:hypothetical protein
MRSLPEGQWYWETLSQQGSPPSLPPAPCVSLQSDTLFLRLEGYKISLNMQQDNFSKREK